MHMNLNAYTCCSVYWNTDYCYMAVIGRNWRSSFLYAGATLAIFSYSENKACCKDNLLVRTSFKTWVWFFKIVVGFLHGPVFLFKLRLFVIVATSFSLARFTENEFITLFKYLLHRYFFTFGIWIQGWSLYWQKRFIKDFVLLVTIFPFIVLGSDWFDSIE